MPTAAGHVTLVGAGPGDPDLLTLAAVRALANADVVMYDALLSHEVLGHCRADARLIDVGKRAGAHSKTQESINELIIDEAKKGRRVVRLKGGDPFVFGRGGEEALACRAAGIAFSVVPGISSAVAVPAYAGIPVTHRGVARSFAVITGSDRGAGEGQDWHALAKIDTIVVLMGAATLAEIAVQLVAAGRAVDTPAAAISNGTLANQQSVRATLGTIADQVAASGLPTPLITVIGEVAALGDELAWREAGPLAGRSVVVTRTRTQASQLRASLEALGANVIETPVLEIRFTGDDLTTDERVSSRWDWIVFSSQNGVDAFFARLHSAGRDARSLGGTKVAAVGAATAAALERHGVVADFVPSLATAETLAEELPRVSGARIFLPTGSLSDDRLAGALRARGGHVEQVQVYETVPMPLSERDAAAVVAADAITFASASSARFLRLSLGEGSLSTGTRLCAIGAQAAAAVEGSFGRVDSVASEPSIAGLVAAVLEQLR
ncbi:MAG: uroporphyrinogen-III C-methyltransferase [Tepidiformaceae bacterium]